MSPFGLLAPGRGDGTAGVRTAVGLTPHFRAWLAGHGDDRFDFARADLAGGSFGGRLGAGDRPRRRPVVFVHGNADAALGTPHPRHSGWDRTIRYFLEQGYQPCELYATTWGDARMDRALRQYHSRAHVAHVRAFLEAVLAYTGAERIDVIAHSMGVTLARKALKGGPGFDPAAGGRYDLGAPLGGRVATLVGIAGANQGLVSSYLAGSLLPIHGAVNGFYPGVAPGIGLSRFLHELNTNPAREAEHVVSVWSHVDEVIGPGNLVWGRRTSRIPGQADERVYAERPYGHIGLKDETVALQHALVTRARDPRVR